MQKGKVLKTHFKTSYVKVSVVFTSRPFPADAIFQDIICEGFGDEQEDYAENYVEFQDIICEGFGMKMSTHL